MSEIYLVRHGQASFGTDNYDKLSPLGHQQAQWLGQYFKDRNLSFDEILTGELVRHHETVAGITDGLNVSTQPSEILPELNEFDFHNVVAAYIKQYPEYTLDPKAPRKAFYHLLKQSMHAWSKDEISSDLSESWENFSNRVRKAISDIQANHSGKKILVVSSGGVIAMAMSQILKTPRDTVIELNLQTKNTGLSHYFFNPKAIRLTGFNSTPHLDTPERRQHITFS